MPFDPGDLERLIPGGPYLALGALLVLLLRPQLFDWLDRLTNARMLLGP